MTDFVELRCCGIALERDWRFCPKCGRPLQPMTPGRLDSRKSVFTVVDLGRMRSAGMTWKAIGAAFGYTSGQRVNHWAQGQWKRAHPLVYDGPLPNWWQREPDDEENGRRAAFSKAVSFRACRLHDELDDWLVAQYRNAADRGL